MKRRQQQARGAGCYPLRSLLLLLLLLVVVLPYLAAAKQQNRPGASLRRLLFASKTKHQPEATESKTSENDTATTIVNNNSTQTCGHSQVVQDYVASVQAKDSQGGPSPDTTTRNDDDPTTSDVSSSSTDVESAPVNVKWHSSSSSSSNHKKSNAVGDPDGSDDDDDDDDEDVSDIDSDWHELLEDDDNILEFPNPSNDSDNNNLDPTTQVQVELELVEDDEQDDEQQERSRSSSSNGGGVGVRLSQRLGRDRKHRKQSQTHTQKETQTTTKRGKTLLWQAWQPYLYYPPGPAALQYLADRARSMDGASKSRLDRRTLYAGLLLEWSVLSSMQGTSNNNKKTSSSAVQNSYRKYLDAMTSQQLQSALSMASQPQWRKTSPRHSGIRLYEKDFPHKGCTLAMQETIAMALAHSMGAGMLVLDDDVLSSVQNQLRKEGFTEDEVKPANVIKALLALSKDAPSLTATKSEDSITKVTRRSGTISSCMKQDLTQGLDDPYDERATSSCNDMVEWEEQWSEEQTDDSVVSSHRPMPLVIFLRAESSQTLLRSKSAVEVLLQECDSSESINLIVLGKGIDAKTTVLPQDASQDVHEDNMSSQQPQRGGMTNAAPWFGFSPNNQNASGQNDPQGSRRFNIFLARTIDPSGTPGILGAIAPPQAGNLFPHMMAMQARERMQQEDDDSPVKAELERWAQQFQEQMQSNGGNPLPPPQFFNASLAGFNNNGEEDGPGGEPFNSQPPPPEVIQETLQRAMGELLDRLAQLNDEEGASDLSPDLHRAFAQVLRNENLRRGIAENLARAAPALSDPKCQGVMLSVYVPPPPQMNNQNKLPGVPTDVRSSQPNNNNMGGWFQKILNNQEDATDDGDDEESKRNSRHKRVRTMAAAAAMMAAKNAKEGHDIQVQTKADRNLARLESLCRPIIAKVPADPVRAKAWEAWIHRERGAVIFRQNRRVLNDQLESHSLTLQEHVGTRGAGSALRQMLSVRDIGNEMENVIKCAIELEAAKAQRQHETPTEMHEKESSLDVDITLSQLLLTDEGLLEDTGSTKQRKSDSTDVQYIHPSSLETALTMICRISPSPNGGLTVSGSTASHRTREELSALAQDKHERALISQVVSPQDIGVTYDMIGGLTDVKELLRQSITYPLKFPHLYSEGIAREAVKGVLLFGPPGTGKTMLAKAVATEGGASFLSVDASSVENKWLGESEKNAKAVFTLARRLAPCVIFIDEVDSLLSSREGTSDDSAHGTLTSVKTTMMSEWDGLNSGTNGAGEAGSDRVVVIGSTNRPFDLDEAVLRRFPRRILVDLPDLETRTEILEVTLAENRLDPSVNLTKIAERLEGYTGSDIKEVCREAVVQISHEQAKLLDQGFTDSREDVTQGSLQRLRPVTVEDFEKALSKLKRSVSEKGRELARVWEWNDEYGEIKKEARNQLPHLANMYL